MEHHRAVADQAARLDRAALEMHEVADDAVVADHVGFSVVVCSTALSWMLVRAPTWISPSSPRSTAPGQIELSGPIVTAPITTASGWT